MKQKYILLIAVLLLTTLSVSAQRRAKKPVKAEVPDTALVVKQYLDSLNVMRQRLDSLQQVNDQLRTEQNDGRYFRLFAPTTFYHSGAQKTLSLQPRSDDEVADAIDQAMMNIYLRRPDLVVNNESNLQAAGTIREDVNQELTQELDLTDIAAPVPEEPEAVPISIVNGVRLTAGSNRELAALSMNPTHVGKHIIHSNNSPRLGCILQASSLILS